MNLKTDLENNGQTVEYRKGILLASQLEIPIIIIFVYALLRFAQGTLSPTLIVAMFIVGIIKLGLVYKLCKESIGTLLSIGMGISGLIYSLILILFYYMN